MVWHFIPLDHCAPNNHLLCSRGDSNCLRQQNTLKPEQGLNPILLYDKLDLLPNDFPGGVSRYDTEEFQNAQLNMEVHGNYIFANRNNRIDNTLIPKHKVSQFGIKSLSLTKEVGFLQVLLDSLSNTG